MPCWRSRAMAVISRGVWRRQRHAGRCSRRLYLGGEDRPGSRYGAEVQLVKDRARRRRTKRSASPIRYSTPATTGSRSSSRERNRSPMSSGRFRLRSARQHYHPGRRRQQPARLPHRILRIARRRPDQETSAAVRGPAAQLLAARCKFSGRGSIRPCRAPVHKTIAEGTACAPAAASRNASTP